MSQSPSGDVKPDVSKIRIIAAFNGKGASSPSPRSSQILISPDITELTFLYKKNKPLAKLLIMFCEKINVDRKSVRFNVNGRSAEQDGATAEGLEMEDDDVLDGQLWQACVNFVQCYTVKD
ncbi:hypothetical protein C8J57DRAFT_1502689 [Mycena rebaudengoi]|nr:hypothetical protein C8J57DRAFT_1502689 [Mycena rebaudengoi]